MFAFFSEFPKKDELGKTNKFKASPVQTEVDMEPSPPELVRGASVNQSKKLRLLHTSSIAHQIKTTEESERQRIHGPSLENEQWLLEFDGFGTNCGTFLYYN
ncbi:unnamed protein product [Bursaphelenchus xylophilus]|nr:unnamed protein product [Bursaphelenchus xylophilus]CAG9089239.1 unnamed protein product [Bursaphelenchus xylophilus]